jgi:ABC-2 type transport system ATP-binding protein
LAEIITVKDLEVVYGDGTRAVDGISFDVGEGEFFGFLGPNGAGKSTTIKVLTTLLRKRAGSVNIAGLDIDKNAEAIRKVIGVQSQDTVVDGDLTGRENLMLEGHFHGMKGDDLKARVDELLGLVQLTDVADRRAAHYSGGMKKRLDLATALVHKPRVLFLDEPTTGLDPQSRASVWEYLRKLNDEGMTVFLTTQYMEEADKLCDRLSIIDHGKLVTGGTPAALKSEVGTDTITLSIENGDGDKGNEVARGILEKMPGVAEVRTADGGLTVYAKNAGQMIVEIVRTFDEKGIRLASVSFASPTLDDIFLHHTGRRIRVEELNTKQPYQRFGAARRPTRQ